MLAINTKFNKHNFFVVVPFYNEEKLILGTLDSLKNQTDHDFSLIVVDNNSTDSSVEIIESFIKANPDMSIQIISEQLKGTGAAADTGFRKAIALGAKVIARTDADSLPCKDWVSLLKKEFETGALIVGGKLKPRTDEPGYRWWDGIIMPFLVRSMEIGAGIIYNGKGYNYRMFMIPGLNMAIDADLYLKAGGFPRQPIDEVDDDRILHMNVRKIIQGSQARFAKKAIVYGSIRKAKAFGYIGIMLWYWDRKYKPKVVDVR